MTMIGKNKIIYPKNVLGYTILYGPILNSVPPKNNQNMDNDSMSCINLFIHFIWIFNAAALLQELGFHEKYDECRLFVDVSKISLRVVILDNSNKY